MYKERLFLIPSERRERILRVIQSARKRILISLFRCTDTDVLEELDRAMRRKVKVQALVTARAKAGKKRLKELGAELKDMGAEVYSFSDPVIKYHAKYMVVDDGPAVVASLNFTKKCFRKTCDFLQLSYDPEVVIGLTRLFKSDCRGSQTLLPPGLSDRLIVGPDRARLQLAELMQQARQSIHIVDPKVSDPEMLALLEMKKAGGIDVKVLSGPRFGNLIAHGKMLIVDRSTAVIGSIALSAVCLEFRRELALKTQDAHCVSQLSEFFRFLAGAEVLERGTLRADSDNEDDDENDDDE